MTHPTSDENEFNQTRGGQGRRRGGKGRGKGKGRGGRRGPASGRASKRALRHGDLRYLILALTAKAPRHGYDMMSEIEALSKGAYKPSPGVMYPALELVQDMGLAHVEVIDGKKSYTISAAGTSVLEENKTRVAEIYARLESLGQPNPDGETQSLRMTLDGLRHDVKSYLRTQKPDDKKREQLTAIIKKAREDIAELEKEVNQK